VNPESGNKVERDSEKERVKGRMQIRKHANLINCNQFRVKSREVRRREGERAKIRRRESGAKERRHLAPNQTTNANTNSVSERGRVKRNLEEE
jgi:hypothetical protein